MSHIKMPCHLQTAFDELDRLKKPKWAYTLCIKDKKKEREVRFDPSKSQAQRYVLLSVNGRKPSQDELEKYQERRAKVKNNSNEFSIKNLPSVAEMIHGSTLEKAEESEQVIRYRFKPKLDVPIIKKVLHKLDGEMHYCKQNEMVSLVTINNAGAFTPMPSFNIEKLYGAAIFGRLPDGHLQLFETSMSIRGKKFFVSAIEEEAKTIYRDYEQVIFDE